VLTYEARFFRSEVDAWLMAKANARADAANRLALRAHRLAMIAIIIAAIAARPDIKWLISSGLSMFRNLLVRLGWV
jgi:hypothetical protein